MKYNKTLLRSSLFIAILFFIDIITKYFVFLQNIETPKNILYITTAKNYGSAFGIFSNLSWYNELILVLSLIIAGFLIYEYFFSKQQYNGVMAGFFIFFIAGLLGNTFDRILYGYVRDIIGFSNFFIFNIADCLLIIGVVLGFIEISKDLYKIFSSLKKAKF